MNNLNFINRNAIILLLLFVAGFANTGCSQTKTYWVLSNVYRENGEPMMGMTLDYMEGIARRNTLLIKSGASIHVDFPEKLDFNIDTIRSITYTRIQKSRFSEGLEHKLVDSIYHIEAKKDTLKINLYYGGTTRVSDRFVVEYEKITEPAYIKVLQEEEAAAKSQRDAIDAFIGTYKFDASWKTAAGEPLKSQTLDDPQGKAVIRLPGNFFIDGAGSLYINTIDGLRVGTIADDNVQYKIVMENDNEHFGDANLFMIRGKEDQFNLKRYLAGKKYKVVDQDDNSFHAIEVAYNEQKRMAEIINYISFKHFYKDGLHIIYLSEDDNGASDPVALAKRHYVLMRNINLLK